MIRKGGRTERRMRKLMWKLRTPQAAVLSGVRLPIRHALIAPHIRKEIALGGYERKEVEILERRLAPGDRVLEVGAGIGFLTCWCAKRVGSDKVFSFEANPALLELIAATCRENGVSPTVRNAVLAKSESRCRFYVEPEFWASSLSRRSEQAQEVWVPQADLNVEMARIQPSFLLVDIEGGELEFFNYAELRTVQKICVEVHPDVIGDDGITLMLGRLFAQGFVLDCQIFRKNVLFLYRHAAGAAP